MNARILPINLQGRMRYAPTLAVCGYSNNFN